LARERVGVAAERIAGERPRPLDGIDVRIAANDYVVVPDESDGELEIDRQRTANYQRSREEDRPLPLHADFVGSGRHVVDLKRPVAAGAPRSNDVAAAVDEHDDGARERLTLHVANDPGDGRDLQLRGRTAIANNSSRRSSTLRAVSLNNGCGSIIAIR
jgi:hypothetical protein